MVVRCSGTSHRVGHALEQPSRILNLAIHRVSSDEDVVDVCRGLNSSSLHSLPVLLHQVETVMTDNGVQDGFVGKDIGQACDGTALDILRQRAQVVKDTHGRAEVVVCTTVSSDHCGKVAAVNLEVATDQFFEDPID